MKLYFYWYRSVIGRWAACIDTNIPSKGPDRRMPKLAFEPKVLEGDTLNLSLSECMALWPAPND